MADPHPDLPEHPEGREECGVLGLCELPKGHDGLHSTSVDRAAALDATRGYLVFEGPNGELMRTPYRAALRSTGVDRDGLLNLLSRSAALLSEWTVEVGDTEPRDANTTRLIHDIRAALSASPPAPEPPSDGGLDAAWAEVERLLPAAESKMRVERVWIERKEAGHYVAMASGPDGQWYPDGAAVDADTPAAALRALATRLRTATI